MNDYIPTFNEDLLTYLYHIVNASLASLVHPDVLANVKLVQAQAMLCIFPFVIYIYKHLVDGMVNCYGARRYSITWEIAVFTNSPMSLLECIYLQESCCHCHSDIMQWKRCPHYRLFIEGIHR